MGPRSTTSVQRDGSRPDERMFEAPVFSEVVGPFMSHMICMPIEKRF